MLVPEGILCTKSHEYLLEDGSEYKIGLTDYGLEQLGDIVFVELPEVDTEFVKGEVFATIESVRAATEIYMPASGKITKVNEKLIESPEIINESPYEDGWLIKITSDTVEEESGDLLEYMDYRDDFDI